MFPKLYLNLKEGKARLYFLDNELKTYGLRVI